MEEVSAADRDSAKAINWDYLRHRSYGLAKGTKLTQAQAQQYIDQYFARYPQVRRIWIIPSRLLKLKVMSPFILNRRRYPPDINSRNYQRRSLCRKNGDETRRFRAALRISLKWRC